MATCAYCGSGILFGGKKQGDRRYCNDTCLKNGYLLSALELVPKDLLDQQIQAVHQGPCPKCGREGVVDVHTSHRVWSMLIMTSWSSRPQICCRSCGVKSKLGDAVFCFFLGWWGIPWGILMTPIQVLRNLFGLFTAPNPEVPSASLQRLVGLDVAARVVQAQAEAKAQQAAPPIPPPPPPPPVVVQ